MKRFKFLLIVPMLLALAACNNDDGLIGPEGPPGPPGADGPQGPQGEPGESGFLFEYEVDFVAPDYEAFLNFNEDFPDFLVYNEDKVLAYLLWDVTEDDVDVWRPLPQTIFLDDGMFQYNFDFTMYDVRLFMDGSFDLSTLQDGDLLNQIVRIVIVPAQWGSGRMDFSNYDEVAEQFGLPELKVDRSDFKRRN